MAFTSRVLYTNCHLIRNITKSVLNVEKRLPITLISNGFGCRGNIYRSLAVPHTCFSPGILRQCSTQKESKLQEDAPKKKGVVQRLKEMYKNYWYVVLPVHMVTSTFWFGGAYYLVRSGVDVPAILESLGLSEGLVKPLRESSAGYVALTFALYKILAPLRYAVTIGGTTYAIKRLTAMGWIKPVPSKERMKEMIQQTQDQLMESKQHYQNQMKEKSAQIMDDLRRYKTEMKNTKNKKKSDQENEK